MTHGELQTELDRWYPGQFVAEVLPKSSGTIRVRRRVPESQLEDKHIIGFYDLSDETLTFEMVRDDVEQFLSDQLG